MKPNGWFIDDIRMPPGIPRVIRLRLSSDETPIYRADFIFLGDRQYRIKGAAGTARHVLGAEHRAIKFLQEQNLLLEAFWPSVIVKGDHIGVLQLHLLRLGQGRPLHEVNVPDSAGQW